MNMPFLKDYRFYLLICFHILLWVLISQLTAPSLDVYGDMVESYAWGKELTLGSFKHPPFLAWLNHAWFAVFPVNNISYYILSYINATIGVLGILALAQLFLIHSGATRNAFEKQYSYTWLLTLTFTLLSGAYSNYAAKYNADTILISIWPWITFTFFYCQYNCDTIFSKLTMTLVFTILAAAGILAKYFTAILLLSLLIISLVDKQLRASYQTIYPYLAALVTLALLSPHILWEYKFNFPFTDYVGGKFEQQFNLLRFFKFPLSVIYQLPLTWLAFIWLYRKKAVKQSTDVIRHLPIPMPLILMCLLPVSITMLTHIILHVHLTTHWAIPIWFCLPILMTFWIVNHTQKIDKNKIIRLLCFFWGCTLVVAASLTFFYSYTGNTAYTMARQEMSRTITQQFNHIFPQQTLSWVGGTWSEPATLTFYLPQHPFSLPGFPDQMPALVNAYPNWQTQYGIILCYPRDDDKPLQDDLGCITQAKQWLTKHNLPVKQQKIYYQSEGKRYLKPIQRAVTVFWVKPKSHVADQTL